MNLAKLQSQGHQCQHALETRRWCVCVCLCVSMSRGQVMTNDGKLE